KIALTGLTIPVKDHLLPQYAESVLLGNRYIRFSNYTVSILDRLTFQADHVVVGASYRVVPGNFGYRAHLLNEADLVELLERLVDGSQRNHREALLDVLINNLSARMFFGEIQGLIDGQPLKGYLKP